MNIRILIVCMIVLWWLFAGAQAKILQAPKPAVNKVVSTGTNTGLNTAEQELLTAIAQYRKQKGKKILQHHVGVASVARSYAQYLVDNKRFSHDDKQGKDTGYRLTKAGFPSSFWWEVIANAKTAKQALETFKKSTAHNDILLSNTYNMIGVGAIGDKRVVILYYQKPLKK